jgi:hypothetical protein
MPWRLTGHIDMPDAVGRPHFAETLTCWRCAPWPVSCDHNFENFFRQPSYTQIPFNCRQAQTKQPAIQFRTLYYSLSVPLVISLSFSPWILSLVYSHLSASFAPHSVSPHTSTARSTKFHTSRSHCFNQSHEGCCYAAMFELTAVLVLTQVCLHNSSSQRTANSQPSGCTSDEI